MKYRVYYLDEPDYLVGIVDAANHRGAAQQYFSQHVRNKSCQIRVETKGVAEYSVQDFDAVEFMDESARASLSPVPPVQVPPVQSSVTRGASSQAKLQDSFIAGLFRFFAVFSLIPALLAIVLLFSGNSSASQLGSVLLPAAIGGGLFCLAVANIIQCLHESSQRLERIEKLLERR